MGHENEETNALEMEEENNIKGMGFQGDFSPFLNVCTEKIQVMRNMKKKLGF